LADAPAHACAHHAIGIMSGDGASGGSAGDTCEADNALVHEQEDEDDAVTGAARDSAGADQNEADSPPEMMDLVDAIAEAASDAGALAAVLRDVGRRARISDSDRDALTDFEGVAEICKALKEPPHLWKGEAMIACCRVLPDICRKSLLNRGALRDEGFLDATVDLLRTAILAEDEPAATAASTALTALCTANDGNKQVAARKREMNTEELIKTNAEDLSVPLFRDPDAPGALDSLLEALKRFPASATLQTQALGAFRCLVCDDDPRQATCMPSAVENREWAVGDDGFPRVREAIERAFALKDDARPLLRLREQAMLLLKEVSCREDKIHEFIYDAGMLPRIETSLDIGDERMVRASLSVIRAFGFADDIKEQLAVESNVALRCVEAVQRHVGVPTICEQGFGLFANLTMRKPHIATLLNGPKYRVVAVGQVVLQRHVARPGVVRSVIQTARNVATQDEAAGLEVRESGLLEELRRLVCEHEEEASWRSPVEIAKQFLREFRADDGVRKAAQYNEYY